MPSENLTRVRQAVPTLAVEDPSARRSVSRESLWRAYCETRDLSERLAQPLTAEDQMLQSMPDASPTKWHLAHTTWFFETLVLAPHAARYRRFDDRFSRIFNSYYESLGPRHPRPQRGVLSRPALGEIWRYREFVDRAMQAFIADGGEAEVTRAMPLITLGIHHEQQHQELILTDIKHAFSLNPLGPRYAEPRPRSPSEATPMRWVDCAGGIVSIGHEGDAFAFDNEAPRHRVLLAPYRLASRPVTCGEFLEFMRDGGYRRPELWLSEGWSAVQAEGWQAPGYWADRHAGRSTEQHSFEIFTLQGWHPIDETEPVCHLSFFEAAAYAQWADARLPTEFEWEAAAAEHVPAGAFSHRHDIDDPHPAADRPSEAEAPPLRQMFGEVWEWTSSAYAPYPGFRPLQGVASEYNGKFMINQMVLRGGSCATPPGHLRASYRNFFPAGARWQFSGLRLAQDAA